jgi:H+/Cl- antiporter ClcA
MIAILKKNIYWIFLTIPMAIVTGCSIGFFLWLLNTAIHFRFQHPGLIYLLPLAGILIYGIYKYLGANSEKGNNLIIKEIHEPGEGIPPQMGPVILVTTVITHLFGGSAGREGTAVQIGGSIAAIFGKWFKLDAIATRIVMTAGIAAGFGAVFGTTLTGAIFAIEVLTAGRIKYDAFFPCLAASIIADQSVALIGVHHTVYHIDNISAEPYFLSAFLPVSLLLIGKVLIAAIPFGLASKLFIDLMQVIKSVVNQLVKVKWMMPVIGGLLIIGLTILNGKPDYLSLGVDPEYPGAVTIPSAFQTGGSATWSWLWKTVYTSVTLATGFKGGEVTPLFYIGATLGNTLSAILNAPVSLFAALGFIAVFSGATKTPVACAVMGAELFGPEYLFLFAIACFTAYLFSGTAGIYAVQPLPEADTGYLYKKLDKYRFHRSGVA